MQYPGKRENNYICHPCLPTFVLKSFRARFPRGANWPLIGKDFSTKSARDNTYKGLPGWKGYLSEAPALNSRRLLNLEVNLNAY